MNQKKAGVLISYATEFVKILSSLLYTPVMLRLLGQSEYGTYQLAHSVVAYLGLLNLGFTAAYARYYFKTKTEGSEEDVARLNGMFMTVFLVISVIAALCGGVLIRNLRGIFASGLTDAEYRTARILMILMVFNLCVTFPDSVFNCIITTHEQFFFQRIITFLQALTGPFFAIPLMLMGYGSVGIVCVTTFFTLSRFALDIWFVFRKIRARFLFDAFDFTIFRDLWGFTFFIFLNQVIEQVNWNVDRVLLGRIVGTTAVAVYGIGANFNALYIQYSSVISTVFAPQINRIVAERDDNAELSALFTRIGRIQFILLSLVLSGFVFFGKPFVLLWAGRDYGESYAAALWLMAPSTVPLIQSLGNEILRAKNMHRTQSIVYFLIALANIGVSIPLIYRFGVTGATIGTAIALTVGNILFMNWYYARRVGLEIPQFWREIASMLPALAPPVLFGVFLLRRIELRGYLSVGLWALAYLAVFGLSMWLLGLNDSEKQLASKLLQRLRRSKQ